MTTPLHPRSADYLERLRRDARALPSQARTDLIADIEAHLSEATDPSMSDAEVLTVLDQLGDPQEIVDAQMPAVHPDGRLGMHEWAAIVLLLLGGFVFGIGWIAGLILLWSSSAWRTLDKWIGTLVLPGGLAGGLFLLLVGLVDTGTPEKCRTITARAITIVNGKPTPTAGTALRSVCTGGAGGGVQILVILLLIVAVLAPIGTAIYLARRARRPSPIPA